MMTFGPVRYYFRVYVGERGVFEGPYHPAALPGIIGVWGHSEVFETIREWGYSSVCT